MCCFKKRIFHFCMIFHHLKFRTQLYIMNKKAFLSVSLSMFFFAAIAQQKAKPEDTEVWKPVPKIVNPGKTPCDPPSDAIMLFNGTNLNSWVSANDTNVQAKWILNNGLMKVDKAAGDIQ